MATGAVLGLAAAAGARGRRRDLGRQHDGAGPRAPRPGRAAHPPRPGAGRRSAWSRTSRSSCFLALMPALGVLAPDRLLLIARGLAVAALDPGAVLPAWPPASCRRILTRVARTRNEELFLLVALTIGLGAAALTESVGLSVALGAFLAGLLIRPVGLRPRDAGPAAAAAGHVRRLLLRHRRRAASIRRRLFDNVPLLVTMVGLVVVGKLVIRAGVVRLFGETSWTALLTGRRAGPDRRVLVRARAGRPPGGLHRPGHLPGHAGRLARPMLLNATLVRLRPAPLGAFRLAAARAGSTPRVDRRDLDRPRDPVRLRPRGQRGGRGARDLRRAATSSSRPIPTSCAGCATRGIPSLFGDASQRRLLRARRGRARRPGRGGAARARSRAAGRPQAPQASPSLPILARSQDRAASRRGCARPAPARSSSPSSRPPRR